MFFHVHKQWIFYQIIGTDSYKNLYEIIGTDSRSNFFALPTNIRCLSHHMFYTDAPFLPNSRFPLFLYQICEFSSIIPRYLLLFFLLSIIKNWFNMDATLPRIRRFPVFFFRGKRKRICNARGTKKKNMLIYTANELRGSGISQLAHETKKNVSRKE